MMQKCLNQYTSLLQKFKGYVMSYGDVAKLAGVKNPRWVEEQARKYRSAAYSVSSCCACRWFARSQYAFGGRNVQKEKLLMKV